MSKPETPCTCEPKNAGVLMQDPGLMRMWIHAEGCPKRAPKAEAPPANGGFDSTGMDRFRKPAPPASKASGCPCGCGNLHPCTDGRLMREPAPPAPVSEPPIDPLTTLDAQAWAKEFMRIWSGRWAEVDEGLMIAWFANAIMRGFDEASNRTRAAAERDALKAQNATLTAEVERLMDLIVGAFETGTGHGALQTEAQAIQAARAAREAGKTV